MRPPAARAGHGARLGGMVDAFVYLVTLALLLVIWRGPAWRGRGLPGVRRRTPWAIGHRGVRGAAPENTLAAFRRALDAGLDGLETDVQRSRDGVLVLVHDERVAGVPVARASCSELRDLLPDLATLDELLELVRAHPGTLLNVELKTSALRDHGLARDVALALRASGLGDRVLVSSFNPVALARLRLYAPELRTAYLWTSREWLPRLLRTPWPAGWLHVDALHPDHRDVDAALVARARARGLMVNTWTVNDAGEVARVAKLGVTGIMADDPEELLRALRERP
jgi:glycerophosphoryl diester phosphodiesterase